MPPKNQPPAPEGNEASNPGFDVPASPVIQGARATIAAATERAPVPNRSVSGVFADLNAQHQLNEAPDALNQVAQQLSQRETAARAYDRPAARNYANEAFIDDHIDSGEQCIDMMAGNLNQMFSRELLEVDPGFREFSDRMAYEAFMVEPVVIRIHATRDKNEPEKCFVGVNGNQRWLPRERNVRIPRFLVERLAQAQERTYVTKQSNDPTVDNMMQTLTRNAASYSFSVLHDPNPAGRQWLKRITREGT